MTVWRALPSQLYVGVVATAFALIGAVLGWRASAMKAPAFTRNEAALRALGLTRQEMRVLEQLAAGRSNKEISTMLGLSPNTVKTHLAHLFVKLEVRRRTPAHGKARDLDLNP
ncbi:MAG: helix-turn-helix transcriptional regulator [Caulobacter sp.]